ncbi:MAG: putative nucleotidyl transferase [Chloroflexi bacterium]|jgi:glucose-1-phosphate thymidylyltransferase|nr:putative nucleotidyl transferase [Chloroflexota bacterium]
MSHSTIKVAIPMAGLGTRLRPHTWSKPKQLVSVAGKAMIDHVIDSLSTLPDPANIELINIVGYLGDQIEDYLSEHYPNLKTYYVVQDDPRGQSHAIQLAREHLNGPLLVVFADTLLETNLSFLADEEAEAVVWVKPVPDPRRFGVVELDGKGYVKRLIEKPQDLTNNLAVVGFYYFKDSASLLSAIEEQVERRIQIKGEYFLADAINILLERGLRMRVEKVNVWLDAGTPEALLETNRYLLQHGLDNSEQAKQRPGIVVVPPVFIHPTAQVCESIIGPCVSLGAGCKVEHSIIRESILEDEAYISSVMLENSLVGRRAQLTRRAAMINAGDNTEVTL